MLARRLRRRPNIKQTLSERLVLLRGWYWDTFHNETHCNECEEYDN